MVTANQGFAKENLAVAEKLVHNTDAATLNAIHDDLGAFVSPDELEEFIRNFSEGTVEEAEFQAQGEADVGGEPTTTVH